MVKPPQQIASTNQKQTFKKLYHKTQLGFWLLTSFNFVNIKGCKLQSWSSNLILDPLQFYLQIMPLCYNISYHYHYELWINDIICHVILNYTHSFPNLLIHYLVTLLYYYEKLCLRRQHRLATRVQKPLKYNYVAALPPKCNS
jgi:hypothetical protein